MSSPSRTGRSRWPKGQRFFYDLAVLDTPERDRDRSPPLRARGRTPLEAQHRLRGILRARQRLHQTAWCRLVPLGGIRLAVVITTVDARAIRFCHAAPRLRASSSTTIQISVAPPQAQDTLVHKHLGDGHRCLSRPADFLPRERVAHPLLRSRLIVPLGDPLQRVALETGARHLWLIVAGAIFPWSLRRPADPLTCTLSSLRHAKDMAGSQTAWKTVC